MLPALQVDTLRSPEAIASLEEEWWRLWEEDPRATPFQSPAWLLPWTKRLWMGGEIRSLALRCDGRLAGLAPLFLWGFGEERVRVSFLGSGITDYLDIVAAAGREQACAAAVAEYLRETTGDWDECDLQELRPDSPLLAPGVFDGIPARVETSDVCPVAKLAPSMEEHLQRLDSKFRTDLRRGENKLLKAGAVEFRRGPELVEDLIRLHASRWESRGESGVLAGGDLQQFHRESAQRMAAHGLLRLFGLTVDGKCIAVQYNLAAHGCVYAYLSGFDAEWARFSPGSVLLKHSIEDAMREGIRTFDFLRRGEAFKFQWGAIERANLRLTLSGASASAGSSSGSL